MIKTIRRENLINQKIYIYACTLAQFADQINLSDTIRLLTVSIEKNSDNTLKNVRGVCSLAARQPTKKWNIEMPWNVCSLYSTSVRSSFERKQSLDLQAARFLKQFSCLIAWNMKYMYWNPTKLHNITHITNKRN